MFPRFFGVGSGKCHSKNITCGSRSGKHEGALLVVHIVTACSRAVFDSYEPLTAMTKSEN